MEGQPGDKSPGYYRVSLRDEVRTGFQTSKPQRAPIERPRIKSALMGGLPTLPQINRHSLSFGCSKVGDDVPIIARKP